MVAAIERNPSACGSYNHNLAKKYGVTLYEEDITAVDPAALASNHFQGARKCDIVLGGPPCQGFSVHRINGAGVKDPRNGLILRYFDFVDALRPEVFLMENVPGILWERHREFIDSFYSMANSSGYLAHPPIVLDARDYGVPQRRKRVFILGVRNDLAIKLQWPPPPTHCSPELKGLPGNKLKVWETALAAFEKKVSKSDTNNIHMNHSQKMVDVFKSTPINGGSRRESNRILACHREHGGHSDVYGRIDPSESAPTMTTACVNPSKGRFVHPTEHHGITVRQAARFQTFPDWFMFQGGLMAAGEQVGNAVPVRLAEILLREIRRAVLELPLHPTGKNEDA